MITLIPCAALFLTGSVALSYLVHDARKAIEWSTFLNDNAVPIVGFLTAVQNERSLSIAVLNGDSAAIPALQAQRSATDAALGDINRVAPEAMRVTPGDTGKTTPVYRELTANAPRIRQSVDHRDIDTRSVDDFYRSLAGMVGIGLHELAKATPDAMTAAEEITAAFLFDTAELHSRASAVGTAGTADGRQLTGDERRMFAGLVWGYRHQLDNLGPRLTDSGRARLDRLTHSAEWRIATESQTQLADSGAVMVPHAEWRAAEQVVDTELIGLFRDHLYYANSQAAVAANRLLDRSTVAGIGVAVLAITAFVLALTLSNRLVRRLHSLHTRSLALAEVTLPAMVQRIRDGEKVDIAAETELLDPGRDEIGEVARAFGVAYRAAMVAAAAEARTREGFNRVFLDIAHRSQVLVRRQLDVLDVAEAKQQDPDQLELLFQLDHLATRARRNAENLLLLGGGQPGRRWPDPIAVEQVVRSAFSETKDLTRMSAIRLPEVHVLGVVVADLIHLLAELIDNAMYFSPPHSIVSVSGNRVGRGVVIEIEDQGLGIRFDERERLNHLLADAPEFQEMALAGQRNLGLFVVSRLAQRHGITVSLQDSVYGGVKAIVLVPSNLLAGTVEDSAAETSLVERMRGRGVVGTPPPGRHDPVPDLFEHDDPGLPPWPGEEYDDAGHPAIGPRAAVPRAPAAPRSAARSRAPLPRRHKQSHLAPQLQLENEQAGATGPDHRRPADDVRRAMSSFQRGTSQARYPLPPTTT
ncbi:ATP-binding protein [Nocardia asteroides]|uniref:sensor histidine kinase n=1 Tax=Nocardia asteroides TaxID=1824 RepID=UPI00343B8423